MPQVFVLDPTSPRYPQVRQRFLAVLGEELRLGPRRVLITEPKRSQEQNDKIHPMCRDIARQVPWSVNGRPPILLPEQKWRHFFAGHVRREAEMMPNIDGDGFIVLGVGSSDLTRREASAMVELMYAFGAERGVVFSDPKPTEE